MCCGQKRATMANVGVAYRPNPAPARTPPATKNTLRLRYLQQPRVALRGPVSGRLYEFSGANRDVPVDPRDAVALEQTGLFQRI